MQKSPENFELTISNAHLSNNEWHVDIRFFLTATAQYEGWPERTS